MGFLEEWTLPENRPIIFTKLRGESNNDVYYTRTACGNGRPWGLNYTTAEEDAGVACNFRYTRTA